MRDTENIETKLYMKIYLAAALFGRNALIE